ncbi:MAG: MaoC family dehydratase N-terminal domain-containing protein [Paracoccaceae bacterium]|jgi:3-methylfumaryl-CoA hydratase|nr:MaoC family dehydratase N-terminal domain-containing protein [Paracoccaceae bacterium]
MGIADTAEAAGHEAVGRVREEAGGVTEVLANMLGATIRPGWHAGALAEGDVLPPLWHWAGFPQDTPMEGLGPDGHPVPGAFLPDLGLGRRMWAGGKLRFRRPLHVGERLTKRSEITGVEWKRGDSGPLALVSLEHAISGEGGLAIEESQQIIYLAIPDTYHPPRPRPAPEETVFDEVVAVDSVRLFRYSAATFNGHKIHFDREFTTRVENYPGLIVHGPLQATLLIERAVRHRGGALPVSLSHRGVHPMFEHHPLRLIGVDEGAAMSLCTATLPEHGGHQGMQVRAEWV